MSTDSTKKKTLVKKNKPEHAVVVHFMYGINSLEPLHALENELSRIIKVSGVGFYDGHEVAVDDSDGFLYMYGPNAEHLFKVVKPILEKAEFMKGAKAYLYFRYGNAKQTELEVEI
jgi:hypothetical protein